MFFTKPKYFLLLLSLFAFFSCNKEKNPVPVTTVNTTVFEIESDPRYNDLLITYNSAYLQKNWDCLGYNCNGIVLFRNKVERGYDDFKAFDRTCTNEAHSCAMEIDEAFPDLLVCPCCGSVFNMIGGYMQQGPAKFPLREFQCDFYDGDLRIY